MKDIPAGTFRMGADDGSAGSSQFPVHTVNVSAFAMQETEVTQGQYVAFMGVNPSWLNFTIDLEDREGPVEQVSWYDAALFCNALSKKEHLDTVYSYTGITYIPIIGSPGQNSNLENCVIDYSKKGYRLPTEAEWEYACRGGTTTLYWWGPSDEGYDTTSWSKCGSPRPVAQKKPNPYGLYDITGNVWEWCNDWYALYDSTSQVDPHGPDSAGTHRIVRGGSWYSASSRLRSAYRNSEDVGGGVYYVGFRVVLPK